MDNTSLGQQLKRARKEKGMTQHDLADGIVTSSMICQIENGKAFPSYQVLSSLADRLGKPIEFFVSDTDSQMKQRSSFVLAKALIEAGSYQKGYALLKNMGEVPKSEEEQYRLTLAECCVKLQKYDEASVLLDELLQVVMRQQLTDESVRVMFRLGEIAELSGQYQLALFHWKKALDLCESDEVDGYVRSQLFSRTGMTLFKLGEREEAQEYLRLAYESRPEEASAEETGLLCAKLAMSYREQKDLAQARELAEQATAILSGLDNVKLSYEVKRSMAVVLAKQERTDEAMRLLEECTDGYTRLYDSFEVGLTQFEMASVRLMENRLDEGIALLQSGLTMVSEDDLEAAKAHRLLASLYRKKKELPEAIHHLHLAMGLLHKHGQTVELTEAMDMSVTLYEEWERYRMQKYGQLIIA
ncbi:MAG TPA: CDC27 family protein [Bacilli bacterium]|nr:CDC27 family protein [Bacilli bacterium]